MAEGGENSFVELREEQRGKEEEEEELYMQLEELSVNDNVRKGAKCESCMRDESPWNYMDSRSQMFKRTRTFYERVAVFLCFVCKMYVCVKCLSKHGGHEGMKVRREESERKGFLARMKKRLQRAEREREKTERERLRRKYIAKVMNESEKQRKEIFFSRRAIVCDRVEVKHELDQDEVCRISGLCGLENKRWVVCDCDDDCIKIFKVGSHVLQRYIRFVGSDSKPWDVTEIHLKQNSTEPNLVSGSSSDISGTDRADPGKQCLIAVTLPRKRQIIFIDLSKKPAKPLKVINTEEQCYDIQFYDDKIFTVCSGEDPREPPWYVSILSTDGETLNKFDTDIYEPRLAVVSGRVWLTDMLTNKIQCRNVDGQVVSQITVEGSWPTGISVDPDNNVYVCGCLDNKVYKLDSDLTRYKSVLDQTAGYIEDPRTLCCYRDKLYIGHGGWSSLENFVTVVRLL